MIVEVHDGEGIRVSETSSRALSDNDRLRWWLDGNTLRIQYSKAGIRLINNPEKTLTVSLPKGIILKTASVEVTSADVSISELAAEEVRLNSTSGDVHALTETKKLAGGSTSGSLDIRQESALETVDLGSTSGSITLALGDAKAVTLGSTSGNLFLTLSGSAETLKLGSTSGSITAEAAKAGRAEFGSTSGKLAVRLSAFDELKMDSTSGSVTLRLPEEWGFTGEIGTVSGNFSSEIAMEKNGKTYIHGDGQAKCAIGTTSGDIRIEKAD